MTFIMKYLPQIILAVLLFGAGWMTATWRAGNQTKQVIIEAQKQQLTQSNADVASLNKNLTDVVTKSKAAADQTQTTLDKLDNIRIQTNNNVAAIAQKSQQVSNEISKLGLPKCSYDANYQRVWDSIGQNANANRDKLYRTQTTPAH